MLTGMLPLTGVSAHHYSETAYITGTSTTSTMNAVGGIPYTNVGVSGKSYDCPMYTCRFAVVDRQGEFQYFYACGPFDPESFEPRCFGSYSWLTMSGYPRVTVHVNIGSDLGVIRSIVPRKSILGDHYAESDTGVMTPAGAAYRLGLESQLGQRPAACWNYWFDYSHDGHALRLRWVSGGGLPPDVSYFDASGRVLRVDAPILGFTYGPIPAGAKSVAICEKTTTPSPPPPCGLSLVCWLGFVNECWPANCALGRLELLLY